MQCGYTLRTGMPIKIKCGTNFGFILVNGDECELSGDFGAFWMHREDELEFIPHIELHEFDLDEEKMNTMIPTS